MADKIVVLDGGWLYLKSVSHLTYTNYPQNRFVAGFIGSPKMNFMSVHIEEAEAERVLVQLSNGMTFGSQLMVPLSMLVTVCLWAFVLNTCCLLKQVMQRLKLKYDG